MDNIKNDINRALTRPVFATDAERFEWARNARLNEDPRFALDKAARSANKHISDYESSLTHPLFVNYDVAIRKVTEFQRLAAME